MLPDHSGNRTLRLSYACEEGLFKASGIHDKCSSPLIAMCLSYLCEDLMSEVR